MPSNYIRLVEQRARQQLEQLNTAQQRAIIEAYNSAGKELVRQYRGAKDGTATKALYASYTKKIADETSEIIQKYAIKGAQVAPSVEKLIMQQAFQMAGLDTSVANDKFDNLIGKLGMESVKNVIGGKIYKDGVGLSSRVWQASAMSSNKIQEVIAAGLAQDMGAAKLSKLLQDYVNPTARKNWDNDKIRSILGDGYAAWNKNLEYNALRLARTTLSHTATMSMRQARQVNPYATKIKWHSVHAAGRTCETCEEMDGQIFDTEECPFDHPNGMCYQTHEMEKSLDEIADELAAWCKGEPNEMLDEWWEKTTGEAPGWSMKERLLFSQMSRDELKTWVTESDYFKATDPGIEYALRDKEWDLDDLVSDGKLTRNEADKILSDFKKELEHEYRLYKDKYLIANRYTNNAVASESINSYLRSLPEGADIPERLMLKLTARNADPVNQADTIRALDRQVMANVAPKDMIARRFVGTDYLTGTYGSSSYEELSKQIGCVVQNKSYMSATIDSHPSYTSRPVMMTIECPKGTNVLPTANLTEGEIIFGRNCQYELVDVIDRTNDPISLEGEFEDGTAYTSKFSGIEVVVRMLGGGK